VNKDEGRDKFMLLCGWGSVERHLEPVKSPGPRNMFWQFASGPDIKHSARSYEVSGPLGHDWRIGMVCGWEQNSSLQFVSREPCRIHHRGLLATSSVPTPRCS
jgi:hypothetical protein